MSSDESGWIELATEGLRIHPMSKAVCAINMQADHRNHSALTRWNCTDAKAIGSFASSAIALMVDVTARLAAASLLNSLDKPWIVSQAISNEMGIPTYKELACWALVNERPRIENSGLILTAQVAGEVYYTSLHGQHAVVSFTLTLRHAVLHDLSCLMA